MALVAEYKTLAYRGVTPQSMLKKDDNGYYYCIVGAFNVSSRNGTFYPATPTVKALFEASSSLMQAVREGNCRGELDHPDLFGMSTMEILHRLGRIEETRVCVHYKHFDLVEAVDENRKPILLVYAWLKPVPPYGNVLEERLNNRDSNCAFSVRSYTKTSVQAGVTTKEIFFIKCYDAVGGPGLKITNKLDTMSLDSGMVGLESLEDPISKSILFGETDLENAIVHASSIADVGTESLHTHLTMVKDALGWNKVQVVNTGFLKWDSRFN